MSRLPAVRDGALYTPSHDSPIPVESPEWYAWLDDARSFTFTGATGTFTARHEERSGRHFWYAYRQQRGTLRKTYLGRSAELTLPRMQQAAATLADATNTPSRSNAPHEQSTPLIATKMSMPQPGPSLIARPAVVARYLESVTAHPCTLIAAPPGFGKTTLLVTASQQLKDRGWQVAWLSLEETERDPTRFWTYLLAALDGVQPGVTFAARHMLETPRPSPIERILTALINELATATIPIELVLDDYQRAATPDSDHGLEFLLEHAPAALHLVLATRADPALPLTRLRVQGKIAELHAADLRFSPDEATRFMCETMHVILPPDQLAQLNERTEGWVAGLQLAALSLRDQASIPDLVADPSSTPRYIAEYLIDEVLERQPQDVQTFLLQTAMLERLSGTLCDAVTDRTDSAAMLARLTQAQLFVTPLDAARTWYRYHQLFAEVLCQRLRATAPDVLEQSHRRAAHWLQQQGRLDEAIQHFLAAPAFEDAATLIESESDRLVLRGEIAGLVLWACALPRDILLRHPHLCVLFVIGLFLQGRTPEASTWLDDLERTLETSQRLVETQGEIAIVRAILLLLAGDIDGGVALARQATKQIPPENQLMSSLALWLSNILDLFGEDDISELSRTITEIAEQSQRAGNILVAVMALMTKVSIEVSQCRLHRAAQTAREAIQLTSHPSGREPPLAAISYSTLGEIQREWNNLDDAERALRHALDIGSYLNSPEFMNDAIISLGMVLAARGKYDEALATFEEVRRLAQAQQLVSWDIIQMEVMRVRVLIAQENSVEIARWIDDCQRHWQVKPHHLVLLSEAEDLALARAALALGHASDQLARLLALSETASRAGRLRNAMEAKMLLARIRWMSGERDTALSDLDAALALAAPEGFMRVFLDEGQAMADLLAAYVATRPHTIERTHALKLLATFGRSIAPSPAHPSPSPSVTLSQREQDVLQLLAAGYSNEAIASQLVVAISTVKWHVAHIYRKLSVTSRVQAVARAHDLHLIA